MTRLSTEARAEQVALIRAALARHGNNRARVARELGLSINTVRSWVRAYHLAPLGKPGRPLTAPRAR